MVTIMRIENKYKTAVLFLAAIVFLLGCSKEEPILSDSSDTSKSLQPTEGEFHISSYEAVSSSMPVAIQTTDAETSEDKTSAEEISGEKTSAEETSGEKTSAEKTEPPIPAVTEAYGSVPDSYREDGQNGISIIGRNGHYMGLMPCWGTLDNCETYARAMNKAAELLPNVKVFSMIIPTSSEFYTPEDMTGFTSSQKEKIDYVKDRLSGAVNVDVHSALSAHTDRHIYSRTDHHWQPLGAYYAAEEFAKTAGVADRFPHLSQYTAVTKDGYMGSLYNYSKSENLHSDPELFTLYISPNDSSLKTTYYDGYLSGGREGELFITKDAGAYYISVLGYGYSIAEIKTDCTNGRKLVVAKESYGIALIPFLTECYETIYVCDIKDGSLNAVQLCKDVGATDLLFAVCTYTPADKPVNGIKEILEY